MTTAPPPQLPPFHPVTATDGAGPGTPPAYASLTEQVAARPPVHVPFASEVCGYIQKVGETVDVAPSASVTTTLNWRYPVSPVNVPSRDRPASFVPAGS